METAGTTERTERTETTERTERTERIFDTLFRCRLFRLFRLFFSKSQRLLPLLITNYSLLITKSPNYGRITPLALYSHIETKNATQIR